jgi:hypothetical protein
MLAALNHAMRLGAALLKYAALAGRFARRRKALADGRFRCEWTDRKLCVADATVATGFDAHYVFHTAWAARVLQRLAPDTHVDIGSCLRFVTIASAFVPIKFYD